MFTYGSICSGIEAVSVAWEPLGFKPLWFSEIDKFPSAVLKYHYPNVLNLGDMCGIVGSQVERPDILVGGTPCQAFSIAGLRQGMNDHRGQLTMEFVRIADEINPSYIVWENVPGVLSDKSNAFGCFLGALAGWHEPIVPGRKWSSAGVVVGPKRSIAWRVLDAQHFRVPQRRRRVFLIACPRNGADPTKILFEREGVRRDSPPSREKGSSVAALTSCGVGTCGADDNQGQAGHLIASHTTGQGFWQEGVGTLRAREQESHEHLVCHGTQDPGVSDIAFAQGRNSGQENVLCIKGAAIGRKPEAGPQYGEVIENISYTLNCTEVHAIQNATRGKSQNGIGISEEGVMYTMDQGSQHAVATFQQSSLSGRGTFGYDPDAKVSKPIKTQIDGQMLHINMQVRRLTPIECERLQGFPDNYTNIPGAKDGPRYKALGNSMAVPCMAWIGKRLLL